jgi:hypothetical protein
MLKYNKTMFFILLILMLGIVACGSNIPDNFINKQVYNDMLNFTKNVQKAIKTKDKVYQNKAYSIIIKYYRDVENDIAKITNSEEIPKSNIVLSRQEKQIIIQGYKVVANMWLYLDEEEKLKSNTQTLNMNNLWADILLESLEEFVTISGIPIDL